MGSYIFSIPKTHDSRIENHEELVSHLCALLKNWADYLQHYVQTTETLFGKAEIPFEIGMNEPTLVSSLAASIVRSNSYAIAAEELPVAKEGSGTSDNGRCDLWAHIPGTSMKSEFSFYLEAKRFRGKHHVSEIYDLLSKRNGIPRMLKDFTKTGGTLDQRSSYAKNLSRRHHHYVIGLICIPLETFDELDVETVQDLFKQAFVEKYQNPKADVKQKRLINKFPTSALIFKPEGLSRKSALFASMTILAAGNTTLKTHEALSP